MIFKQNRAHKGNSLKQKNLFKSLTTMNCPPSGSVFDQSRNAKSKQPWKKGKEVPKWKLSKFIPTRPGQKLLTAQRLSNYHWFPWQISQWLLMKNDLYYWLHRAYLHTLLLTRSNRNPCKSTSIHDNQWISMKSQWNSMNFTEISVIFNEMSMIFTEFHWDFTEIQWISLKSQLNSLNFTEISMKFTEISLKFSEFL